MRSPGAGQFARSCLLLILPLVAGARQSTAQAGIAGHLPSPVITLPAGTIERVSLDERRAFRVARARYDDDLAILERYRPGYRFWSHIFTIPDGSIAYGSQSDGRLLATFPVRGDWLEAVRLRDTSISLALAGVRLDSNLNRRRDQVAELIGPLVGGVIHNPTRGNFLLPKLERYGGFLAEWGSIYERFGVPGEIGLAQAMVESGLDGRIQSEARALGFCQWLPANWNRLKRLAHHVIEGYNQTTQAPYCAAYLTILATKYGSFIPALSEHHAGGTNVGRTVINGERLGGKGIRERYLLGSQFALDLREIAPRRYRDVYATYGPRSFRYAEMVFGNTENVRRFASEIPQLRIYAMRPSRSIPLSEITRRTGLSADEVKRFNPALVRQVPAGADLYLPMYVEEFGKDVAFWHREPTPEFSAVLNDFIRLNASLDEWEDPAFRAVLREFAARFKETGTEEGQVMSTALHYVMDEMYSERRLEILEEYAQSERIRILFEQGVRDREALVGAPYADR